MNVCLYTTSWFSTNKINLSKTIDNNTNNNNKLIENAGINSASYISKQQELFLYDQFL